MFDGVVGTDAAQQGRFHGSAALESALAACDASGLPSYLEATSARSSSRSELPQTTGSPAGKWIE